MVCIKLDLLVCVIFDGGMQHWLARYNGGSKNPTKCFFDRPTPNPTSATSPASFLYLLDGLYQVGFITSINMKWLNILLHRFLSSRSLDQRDCFLSFKNKCIDHRATPMNRNFYNLSEAPNGTKFPLATHAMSVAKFLQ